MSIDYVLVPKFLVPLYLASLLAESVNSWPQPFCGHRPDGGDRCPNAGL